jgi:hypothetical protein
VILSLQTRISDLITAIGTDIKQHRTWMTGSASGDLTGLTTTEKGSLVGAINEVQSEVGSGGTQPDASETEKGIVELATLVEVATGTDTTRAVTAAGVKQETMAVATPDSSETIKGKIEIATLAEVATGTDSLRAVTAAGVRQERTALKEEILGAGVPGALDTLDELAAALGDDQNFASSVTTSLAGKQPLDTDLTAIAGLTSEADRIPYATGAGTWALTPLTSAARGLLDDADVATMRGTLSVYSQAELGNPETDLAALYTTAKA